MTELLGLAPTAFLLAFARAGAFLAAAPLTGDRTFPWKLRAAAAVLLAAAATSQREAVDPSMLAMALPAEILMGLAAGFAARLALAGVEAAGQLIGLHLGLGFAGFYDPSLGEESLPTRRLAACAAGLAFLAAGGLEDTIRVVSLAPVGELSGGAQAIVAQGGEVMGAALRLAAPAVVASVVANVALAMASRAAPAMNVFSVALAGVLVIGLAAVIIAAPAFASQTFQLARTAVDAVARALGG